MALKHPFLVMVNTTPMNKVFGLGANNFLEALAVAVSRLVHSKIFL
jgi:hypothetical protein